MAQEVIAAQISLSTTELTVKLHVTPNGIKKPPPVLKTLAEALAANWTLTSGMNTDKGVIMWFTREYEEEHTSKLVDDESPWPLG